MLEAMLTNPGGPLDWAKSHKAKFELDKNALLLFSNKRTPDQDHHLELRVDEETEGGI